MRTALTSTLVALALTTACADCPDGGQLAGEASKEQWCQKIGPDGSTKHGPYRKWHDNGRLFVQGEYRQGQPDGQWRYFNDEGKPLGSCTLTDGTGKWTSWLPGGQKWESGEYFKGQKVGTWETWWRDGKKNRVEEYREGQPHGRNQVWHQSGEIFFDGQYRDGKKCGTWVYHLAESEKTEEHPPCK